MDAVATQGRGWKMIIGAIIVGGVGWAALNFVSESVGLSIAGAMSAGGKAAQPATDCQRMAPDDATWRRLDIQLVPNARTSTEVGSATVSVEPAGEARQELTWQADMGVDALILHGGEHTAVRRFDQERFGGQASMESGAPIDRVTFCYDFELTVNKDANPALTRVYDWSIDQRVEPAQWRLAPGASGVSTYRIALTRDEGTPRDWRVAGTITIDNFTPVDATLESVTEVTDDGIAAQLDCGVPLPGYILRAGSTLTCHYLARLPDAKTRRATTRVRTAGRVRGAKVSAPVDFAHATVETVDETAYVSDNEGRTWRFEKSGTSVFRQVFRCDDDAGIHPSAARIVGTDKQTSTAVTVDCQPTRGGTTASRREER